MVKIISKKKKYLNQRKKNDKILNDSPKLIFPNLKEIELNQPIFEN